jgi:hypothetical protein
MNKKKKQQNLKKKKENHKRWMEYLKIMWKEKDDSESRKQTIAPTVAH